MSISGSRVTAALAKDKLGVWDLMFFTGGSVAPMLVIAGVVTTAFVVTGLIAAPAAFIVFALVLAVWSVGYTGMARHITNAGAMYAFVTRGLWRPVGIAVAMVALVAYNELQVGLYGIFGPSTRDFVNQRLKVSDHWWTSWVVFALIAWAAVAVLGWLKITIPGRVLALLLTAELAVVLALDVAGVAHPAGGHLSVGTLSPVSLIRAGGGVLGLLAILSFAGFESGAVLSEETRNPRRTVPAATFLILAVAAVVYAGSSWAMAVHYGDGNLVATAGKLGPGMLFTMGGPFLEWASNILLLTSVFAAMVAYHPFVTRYIFALAREGVLPRAFARTNAAGAPVVASTAQTVIGLIVIAGYGVFDHDPLVHLFFWCGTSGGFGALILYTVASFAVIGYFARHPFGESVWVRLAAPGVAGVVLAGLVVLALHNYPTLLGVAPGSPVAFWLPAVYGIVAVAGLLLAGGLRVLRPDLYRAIGLTTPDTDSTPAIPQGRRGWPIETPTWQGVDL